MRRFLFHLLIFLISTIESTKAQQPGSFKDPRDGRVYKTVKIGTQVWMAENLNVERFKNGDIIPESKTNEEWASATGPAWCYYNNDSVNGKQNGKL